MNDMSHIARSETALECAEPRRAAPAEKKASRLQWRDQLRIGLAPNALAWARYRRGLRPTLEETNVITLPPPAEGDSWESAVAALRAALAGSGPRRTDVTVVLSNHFVRHALLPWNEALRSDAEWLALARHRFVSVHGHRAEDWVVRVSETGREGPRIASAIDRELLGALQDAIDRPARLVAVQPYLMVAFNRLSGLKRNPSCWFVIAEAGRLTFALIEHGVWRALRTRQMETSRHMTLPEIIERESQLLGLEAPCTDIVLDALVPIDFPAHGPCQWCDVTPIESSRDRLLALAVE